MRLIPLTNGKVAMVDDSDYAKLANHKWQAHQKSPTRWYAQCSVLLTERGPSGRKRNQVKLMHRDILGLGRNDPEVDHIDGDGLNNQRVNLRLATDNQQNYNKPKRKDAVHSQYKGVQFEKRVSVKPWRARIRISPEQGGPRKLSLGCFETELEAARAYDAAALQYHGEYARLNFPEAWVR